MPVVAITGASGFIGRRLVAAFAQSGWQIRVLARHAPDSGLWGATTADAVVGDLDSPQALAELVAGADAVVHLAGLIKASSRSAFMKVNRDGTAHLAAAVAERARKARFVQVSSLAARQPELSDYAASKQAGERVVRGVLGVRALVVRPAAVYGPGDRETLTFFRLARGPWAPLPAPAEARVALIHVEDLCALLLHHAAGNGWSGGETVEAADACPQGYSWREILQAIAVAVGNPGVRLVRVPETALRVAAACGDVGRHFGMASTLTRQKLRELQFPDWSVKAADWAHPAGWAPRFGLSDGFADAVAGYRAAGLLPAAKR